jgi:peptidoglycan/xylan/chitin deacetylase (PgdA/CDA1 family)
MTASPRHAISIMYHDVVPDGDVASSGFGGVGADIYKLDRTEFAEHLAGIREHPSRTMDGWTNAKPVFLTFDDGGITAHSIIAPMLEERGWRGHFFITTDRLGTRGFVDADHVRDLDARGHVIGSHSCSHPARISSCTELELRHEWEDSCARLSELIGRPITVASVPGGFYSDAVGAAAARVGVTMLFTSEPTTRIGRIGDCLLLGRYGVWRGMPRTTSGQLAEGARVPRWKQTMWWQMKKAAKAVPGDPYAKVRRAVLRSRR